MVYRGPWIITTRDILLPGPEINTLPVFPSISLELGRAVLWKVVTLEVILVTLMLVELTGRTVVVVKGIVDVKADVVVVLVVEVEIVVSLEVVVARELVVPCALSLPVSFASIASE